MKFSDVIKKDLLEDIDKQGFSQSYDESDLVTTDDVAGLIGELLRDEDSTVEEVNLLSVIQSVIRFISLSPILLAYIYDMIYEAFFDVDDENSHEPMYHDLFSKGIDPLGDVPKIGEGYKLRIRGGKKVKKREGYRKTASGWKKIGAGEKRKMSLRMKKAHRRKPRKKSSYRKASRARKKTSRKFGSFIKRQSKRK